MHSLLASLNLVTCDTPILTDPWRTAQLNIQVKPMDSVIESGAQKQQMVNIECISDFEDIPILHIQFMWVVTNSYEAQSGYKPCSFVVYEYHKILPNGSNAAPSKGARTTFFFSATIPLIKHIYHLSLPSPSVGVVGLAATFLFLPDLPCFHAPSDTVLPSQPGTSPPSSFPQMLWCFLFRVFFSLAWNISTFSF